MKKNPDENPAHGTSGARPVSSSGGQAIKVHCFLPGLLLCAFPAVSIAQEPGSGTPVPAPGAEEEVQRVESEFRVALVLEGFVVAPDGKPAEGAVVVSSAGGKAVTDVAGRYRLDVEVSLEATSVQITAVGSIGGNLAASTSVSLGGAARTTRVPPLHLALGASCSPSWLPAFGGHPGTGSLVFALTTFDDGGGPALYAGGNFSTPGGVPANRIAKWDGASWTPLGSGMNTSVYALAVYDDGDGTALYAGGGFTSAGGVMVNGIAKWDGTSWTPLGSGVNPVSTLAVYDDGGGTALYAGGGFTSTGGVMVNRIAKWDGTSWTPLGSGMNNHVYTLAAYDDGGGTALYAGSLFTTAGGGAANRIAKWDGTSWTPLGSGMNHIVEVLAVHDDGSGAALYAGGAFTTAGGGPVNRIAKWDGSTWTALGGGMDARIYALAVVDDGGDTALTAGGEFWSAGGLRVNQIAKWDGTSWATLGEGIGASVRALAVYDDGGGPALYVGGDFTSAGGLAVNRIAKWNGTGWTALGTGVSGGFHPSLTSVRALAVYDDGGGPALYAGGYFTSAGGMTANHIAKWDGSTWSKLGLGMNGTVAVLAVYDRGGGPVLYAGGLFTTAGVVATSRIARWNGSSWSALGSGIGPGSNNFVEAMAVHDDGGGPALYVGGFFSTAGGVGANCVARWNGSSWSALGSGTSDVVRALAVHDDGSGPALYAGGDFATAGGVAVNSIARWDDSSWSALGDGVGGAPYPGPTISTLATHDDGGGPALYAGGDFTIAGGVAANRIARWDDSSGWTALSGGTNSDVLAMAVYADGGGPALFAGGTFTRALDSNDSFLARWGCDTVPPVLSCPPSITVLDRSFDGQEVVTFAVTSVDNVDASPVVVCVPPSGSTFPLGTTLVDCTATDASGNQSTCQFQVTVQRKARAR